MPVVAFGVMFWANKDLFAGTPLVGFINILDPVNGIFGQRNMIVEILFCVINVFNIKYPQQMTINSKK